MCSDLNEISSTGSGIWIFGGNGGLGLRVQNLNLFSVHSLYFSLESKEMLSQLYAFALMHTVCCNVVLFHCHLISQNKLYLSEVALAIMSLWYRQEIHWHKFILELSQKKIYGIQTFSLQNYNLSLKNSTKEYWSTKNI